MTAAPTVFVVDDNPGVRKSLQALVEAAGLRGRDVRVGRGVPRSLRPGTRGLSRPGRPARGASSGLDLQDELRRRQATLPIIVMTGYGDVPASVRAFKGGAVDFLRKPVPPKKLLARIREAIEIRSADAREAAEQRASVIAHVAHLTPRERQVMELLAVGKSSKEIAAALEISVRTVEGHRRVVLRKMGVESAVQLARAVAGLRRPEP